MRPTSPIPATLCHDLTDLIQQAAGYLCEPARGRRVMASDAVAERIRALLPAMLAVAVDERPELAELERLAGRANVRTLRIAEAAADAALQAAVGEGVRADVLPAPGRGQDQGRGAVLARLSLKARFLSPAMASSVTMFVADELEARRPRRLAV